MDAPIDFRLDRNRILTSGLTSTSFGNYESAFSEGSSRGSTLNRNASGSIPDLGRAATSASLSQFPSRYFQHASGSTYPLLGGYLPGTATEHLKSLEEYWAARGIEGPRYVLNNNLYSPYHLPYLPATESLSLFAAHNLSTGGLDQSAYHRIYDLRKDAGLYPGLQMVSSPTTGTQNTPSESKKDTSKSDTKRHETGKSTSKTHENTTKGHSTNRTLKDGDKKTEHRKIERIQTPKSSSSAKSYSTKRDKCVKNDDRLDEKNKNIKKNENSPSIKVSKNEENVQQNSYKKESVVKENHKDKDFIIDIIDTKETKPEKEEEEENEKEDDESDIIKKNKASNSETMTTSSNVESKADSSSVSKYSPVLSTSPYKSSTTTTFSLPYYHSLFSTTNTLLSPPISCSTTSTASMCSDPVQTVPCDMRIKKESAARTCSPKSNTSTTSSDRQAFGDKISPKVSVANPIALTKDKNSEKDAVKTKIVSTVTPSSTAAMPLCLKKHILEKSKDWTLCEDSLSPKEQLGKTDVIKTGGNKPSDNIPNDSKNNASNYTSSYEDEKTSHELKPRHSKEIQQLTTTSKDTVKAISKVLSKRQESSDNSRKLSPPRKHDQKLPTKRILIKPKCDDKKMSGIGKIPIGIAVARKREDLKKDESDDNIQENVENSTTSSHERTTDPSSSVTKSIPNINVVDIRSQLPANLIVTGSASGTGIAWSDDPAARHFPTQWLQTPQLNQSWIGQIPFQMPPTSDQTLPITIPPGYKIAQDSVTGQLIMIPTTDIEIFDHSRLWSQYTASAPQPILASHQLSQILPHDRPVPFVMQQYQNLMQNRSENLSSSDNTPTQNVQAATGTIKSKVSKDTSTTKVVKGPDKKKSVGMVIPQITTEVGSTTNSMPFSGPVPLIVNSSLVSNVSCSDSVKTELSTVQSRGTSPMVPASEIEDTAQEMIDNAPAQISDLTFKDSVTDDDDTSFSSTESFINDRFHSIPSNDEEEITKQTIDTATETKSIVSLQNTESVSNKETDTDSKVVNFRSECSDKPKILLTEEKQIDQKSEIKTDENEALDNTTVTKSDEKVHDDYNPFLDPQILQAVDGLELLSALAEKRSKSVDTKLEEEAEVKALKEKDSDGQKEEETPKAADDIKEEKQQKTVKKTKLKRRISRTRSIPPIKESETPSYYTSTGLRIPQGEEEINAIELDMRIRLAELQRMYKEKQKLLSKLQPKKETSKESPQKTKEREILDVKRGPGRPKKLPVSSPGSDTSSEKKSPLKSRDGSLKKKKPAEELVDRVFRKTGGGFGMPLSKKLKANAMAALFKTQSGFTVKRKGSSSSSLMSGGKSLSSSEKAMKIKRKHLHNGSSIKKDGKVLKLTKQNDDVFRNKAKEEKKDKKESLQSGLGLLAKYASNALKQHMSKKLKRKREGSCSEEPQDSPPNCDDESSNTTSNVTNETISLATSPHVEERERKSDRDSPEVQKRKPGRPRKGTPTRTTGVTETLVAKPSKSFQLFQYQSFQDLAKKSKTESHKKQKTEESESPMKPLFLDEEWLRRRSERIFLSDPSPQASPNYSQSTKAISPKTKTEPKSKSDQAKLQKARNMKELTQKVKRKYKKSMEQRSNHKAKKEMERKHSIKKHEREKENKEKDRQTFHVPPPKMNVEEDNSESDGDDIPLSKLMETPSTPVKRTCVLTEKDLVEGLNVLVFKDSLFYEGTVKPIHPPDIYGVLIKNERGNRPHIYSREEILKEVILDIQPESSQLMKEGTRVCAYWSQQFNCLYPGTVSKGTPNPHPDPRFINVEFDDGDSGKIPIDHIRQLPADFPHVSYDPNPLLLIGKRRRHTTSDLNEHRKTDASTASETTPKVKRGPGRPPKIKQEYISEDEYDIDVCGIDDSDLDTDDYDSVFSSHSPHNKQSAKRKHKSETSKDEKVKKKKVMNEDIEDQAFIPVREFWRWNGKSTKRPGMKGKAKKEFYKDIIRGKEEIKVGDCAVFLSTGRPHLPYIGRIDSMWETWGGQMTVKVKWFYHPEETRGGKKLQNMRRALFQSPHFDENDVQTISHKCDVISYTDYKRGNFDKLETSDIYYLAGTYEPTIGLLKFEQDVM